MARLPSSATAARRAARPRRLVLLALLVAPTLLLGAALLPGRALLPADLLVQFEPWKSQLASPPEAHWDALVWDGIAQYYPWRAFAAETLRAGHVPLWNPYQFCGTPFLANGQSAVFYPLNLLFWLLPVAVAFAWSAWLHLALAGWFAYLYLRRAVGLGRAGALAGAVVWQLNSFTVAWLHLPTTLCTAVWLPLILLFGERALLTGRARWAVYAGAALGLSYLGGHPQVFLFVVLFSVAYLVARALSRGPAVPLPVRLGRLLVTGALAGGIAFGLAAVQLLPTLEFLPGAHRAVTLGPDSYAAFLKRALQPLQLTSLLLPHPLGHPGDGSYVGPENYAEYTLYLGLVALGLAIWGAVFSRTWHARFLAAAGVLALLIALGTPVNWPLYHWLPGMARAGGPARIGLLAVFSLSLLAGVGVEAAARHERPAHRAGLAGLLLALALGAWLWWLLVGPTLGEMNSGVPAVLRAEVVQVMTLAVLAAAGLVALRNRRFASGLQIALVVLLALDLALAARGHVHAVPTEWVYNQAADPGQAPGRIIGNAEDWPPNRFPNAVLPPNAATVYHLRDVAGYDSLYLARYRDFLSLLQGSDPSPAFNGNMLLLRLPRVYDLDMTRLAGVDRVFSPFALPKLPLDHAGAYATHRGLGAWPRAWLAQSAVFTPDWRQAQAAMVRLGALSDCVIITGSNEPSAPFPPGARPTAEVQDVSPNATTVKLPRGGGGYLFLADTHTPGWHAYTEHGELSVRAAYLTFRAVAPPPSAHRVDFRYEPASYRLGLFLGLLTLALLAGAYAMQEGRRVH